MKHIIPLYYSISELLIIIDEQFIELILNHFDNELFITYAKKFSMCFLESHQY